MVQVGDTEPTVGDTESTVRNKPTVGNTEPTLKRRFIKNKFSIFMT